MQRFPFRFDDRFTKFLRVIGVAPDNSEVTLTDDDRLVAEFGRLRVDTPLSNISSTQITRNYQWFKAIGARGSFADRGATMGTNTDAGLCVCFHEPIKLLFGSFARHPGLTMTVADPEGLQTAIEERRGAA